MNFRDGGYCTGFPEHWYRWTLPTWWKVWELRTKKIYIGDLCKDHDSECNSMNFGKGMWKRRVVGGSVIVIVASLACLVMDGKV